jgi:WD40 repeat protein
VVRRWDVGSGKELAEFRGHIEPVFAMAFTADGGTLVSGDYGGTIRVWDVAAGTTRLVLRSDQPEVYSVAVSADGKTVVSGGYNAWTFWEPALRPEAAELASAAGPVHRVVFSQDGQTVAAGGRESSGVGFVKLWHVGTGAGPEPEQMPAAAMTDQRWSMVGLAFTPDGWPLAAEVRGPSIRLCDAVSGKELGVLTGSGEPVHYVAVSADARTMASVNSEGVLTLWDVGRKEQSARWTGFKHHGSTDRLALSDDGQFLTTIRLVSAEEHNEITLWHVATRTIRATLGNHADGVSATAFSSDNRLFASATGLLKGPSEKMVSGEVIVWELATGRELGRWRGHSGSVTSLAFSRDGRTLASGGDGTVALWDVATGQQWASLKGHSGYVRVAFSPDGKWLASGGQDGAVKLWDLGGGK